MGIGEMSQQKGHGAPVSPWAEEAGRSGFVSYDVAHASRGETPPLPALRHRLTFAPWRWKRGDMTELSLTIEAAKASDEPAIEKLHQRAFGPGRFARTAYRIREQANAAESLTFVARVGSLLVGSVQLTPVRLGEARAFMLCPLTVEPVGRRVERQADGVKWVSIRRFLPRPQPLERVKGQDVPQVLLNLRPEVVHALNSALGTARQGALAGELSWRVLPGSCA